MNKNMKVIIAVATAMIAAGVILSAVGFALGGFRSVHLGSRGFYVEERADGRNASGGSPQKTTDFTGVHVDVRAYTVLLREGDAYGTAVQIGRARSAPEIRVEDGVLTVRESGKARGFWPVVLGGWLSSLRFGIANSDLDDAVIEITVPSDARMGDIRIEADAGSVEIDGLDTASLSVNCSAGNLKIEKSAMDELHVDLRAGNLEIEDARAGGAEVKLDAGSFVARDFDCGDLRGEFKMGEADVEGSLRGDVDITTDMGSVTLQTDLPKSEYLVDLRVSLGSATVDGRDVSGAGVGASQGGGAMPYSIRVNASMGNVEVKFK
jgi:hypothetical protein